MKKTRVYLVGAGIGAYDMITLRGLNLIKYADCIIYDRLIDERLLDFAPASCEKIYVGKAAGSHYMNQEDINLLLLQKAREGGSIVRLKGGDPYVFGRGGEEALCLKEAGFDFEVVPGVSSAVAAPCFAGIPVTHRQVARQLHICTAHTKEGGFSSEDYEHLARLEGTLVLLMGLSQAPDIARGLILAGMSKARPCAIISCGGTPAQKTLVSTLGNLREDIASSELFSPAIILVGETVCLRDELDFFECRPLHGKKILLTHKPREGDELVSRLELLGAEPVSSAMIEIVTLPHAAEGVIGRIAEFSHIAFTSGNSIEIFMEALFSSGKDARALCTAKLCVLGNAGVRGLSRFGLKADIIPEIATAAGLFEKLKAEIKVGDKILLPQAAIAEPKLENALREFCEVERISLYDTRLPYKAIGTEEFLSAGYDAVVFSSCSTAINFDARVGLNNLIKTGAAAFSIGPATSSVLRALGVEPVESDNSSFESLADKISDYFGKKDR